MLALSQNLTPPPPIPPTPPPLLLLLLLLLPATSARATQSILPTRPPRPPCRAAHPRYRKAERRPPGATAARTPARCVRKRDGKVFALPRLFSRAQCDAMGRRRGGFTARASCAAFR